jgi:hypothetical protein
MFNGHAPGYSNCHSGLVRLDIKLLQQLSACDPHFEWFAARKSDCQLESRAISITKARHLDLHLTNHSGNLVVVTEVEAGIERV